MAETPNVPKLTAVPKAIVADRLKFRIAAYGEPGQGKTTFALTFPDVLVVNTDYGLEGDAIVGVTGDEWTPDKWLDMNALYFWMKEQAKTGKYKTIVVDTIDGLARLILQEAVNLPTKTRNANAALSALVTPEQGDYGKVDTALKSYLIQLQQLQQYGIEHVILLSHVREPDAEKGILKRTINLQPKVRGAVEDWANIIGEIEQVVVKDERHVVLRCDPADRARVTKTRFAAIRDGVADPTYTKLVEQITGTKGSTKAATTKESK